MATATSKPNPALAPLTFSNRVVPVNAAPADFVPAHDLPQGFLDFLAPLHTALTQRQRTLVARSEQAPVEAHAGRLPSYLPPSLATMNPWRIELPEWCADQRNQRRRVSMRAEHLCFIHRNSSATCLTGELERLLRETPKNDPQIPATLREARDISEEIIRRGEFNPA